MTPTERRKFIQSKVVELREDNYTYKRIGTILDISPSTARRMYVKHLLASSQPPTLSMWDNLKMYANKLVFWSS